MSMKSYYLEASKLRGWTFLRELSRDFSNRRLKQTAHRIVRRVLKQKLKMEDLPILHEPLVETVSVMEEAA